MKYGEFKEIIEKRYAEYFKGACVVKKYICLGRSIIIDCYLETAQSGTIADNDMIKTTFNITLPDKFDYETDELPENLTLEAWSRWYAVKPDNKYCVFGSRRIPFRKTTGTAEKLADTAEKFFKKMNDLIVEDFDNENIHPNFYAAVVENVKEIGRRYEYDYMVLSRCEDDCKYYLGAGNRHDKYLWAGNVEDHIGKMKELYNTLPVKPEWITLEKINEYEELMKAEN